MHYEHRPQFSSSLMELGAIYIHKCKIYTHDVPNKSTFLCRVLVNVHKGKIYVDTVYFQILMAMNNVSWRNYLCFDAERCGM